MVRSFLAGVPRAQRLKRLGVAAGVVLLVIGIITVAVHPPALSQTSQPGTSPQIASDSPQTQPGNEQTPTDPSLGGTSRAETAAKTAAEPPAKTAAEQAAAPAPAQAPQARKASDGPPAWRLVGVVTGKRELAMVDAGGVVSIVSPGEAMYGWKLDDVHDNGVTWRGSGGAVRDMVLRNDGADRMPASQRASRDLADRGQPATAPPMTAGVKMAERSEGAAGEIKQPQAVQPEARKAQPQQGKRQTKRKAGKAKTVQMASKDRTSRTKHKAKPVQIASKERKEQKPSAVLKSKRAAPSQKQQARLARKAPKGEAVTPSMGASSPAGKAGLPKIQRTEATRPLRNYTVPPFDRVAWEQTLGIIPRDCPPPYPAERGRSSRPPGAS